MLIHVLNDIYAFMYVDLVNESGIMTAAHSLRDTIVNIVIAVFELAMAFLLLRGNGRKAIMEVWEKKWSHTPEQSTVSID